MLLLLACAQPPGGLEKIPELPVDDADALYDPDVLHEVTITLDPDDWEALRSQTRTYYDLLGPGCMEGPFESPYTYFPGEVTIDGEDLGTIGVRKKGLIGSLSYDRPSFRMDVDQYTDGARFHGLEKVVLNNNNQDQSRMRTCLAHQWFTDAGLVAPRCSLAHVVVNGEDLGVYDNAEAIDPDLVARVRGAEPETMYEGTLSDFRDGWMATFEPETDASDGADLAAVTEALASDDDDLLAALDVPLDLDAFFTFWAAESFAGHWDGYNGNTNNFYVYADPEDGRLEFIASGPDAAFDSLTPFEGAIWVATTSALANRLIQHDEGRARYEAELTRLAEEVWDEGAALDRLDDWKDLARDEMSAAERRAVGDLREIVEARGDDVLDAIGGRVDTAELRGEFCWTEVGTVTVEFETTWGTYPTGDLYEGGEASTYYELQGVEYTSFADGVTAGEYDADAIWITISEVADGVWLAPYVIFDRDALTDGAVITIGDDADGALLYRSSETGSSFQTAAYMQGTLTFSAASEEEGAPLIGVLEATLLGGE